MVDLEAFGPGEEPETKQTHSLQSVSDDDLDAALDGVNPGEQNMDDEVAYQEPTEVEFGEEEAKVPEEADKKAEPEAVQEPAEATAEEEAPAETEEDTEKEILRLQLIEEQADKKRLESVVGGHGGKIGWLERQLRELREQQATPAPQPVQPAAEDTERDPWTQAPQAPVASPSAPKTDNNTVFLVKTAIQQAAQAFNNAHGEVFEKGEDGVPTGNYRKDFVEMISASQDKLAEVLESNDPVFAQEAVSGILETSYWSFVRKDAATRRAAMESKRADQAKTFKDQKRAAAVTSSSAPPPQKPRARTLSDVPESELDNYLDKTFGRGQQ